MECGVGSPLCSLKRSDTAEQGMLFGVQFNDNRLIAWGFFAGNIKQVTSAVCHESKDSFVMQVQRVRFVIIKKQR